MAAIDSSSLLFFVNGRKVIVKLGCDTEADTALAVFLRETLGLSGCKISCGIGGCGACTVMVSHYDKLSKAIFHVPVNACITPLCAVDQMAITTVEGIGSTKTRLHPVQERIAKAHGVQCGFCTPGMVMSMYTLLRNRPSPTLRDIDVALGGNYCRCSGYRSIYEGFKTFTNESCCQGNSGGGTCCKNNSENAPSSPLFNTSDFAPYDSTQEPIFPPELMLNEESPAEILNSGRLTWLRPSSLEQCLKLADEYPNARRISGMIGAAISSSVPDDQHMAILSLAHVPELNAVDWNEQAVTFGASVTMATMENSLADHLEKLPELHARPCKVLLQMLDHYGNKQVRHMFSISSNVLPAAPDSDLNVLLVALYAQLNIISTKGIRRTVPCDDKFLISARKTSLADDELLVSVTIPLITREHEYMFFYRQALAAGAASAIVNAAMRVVLEPIEGGHVIKDCCLAYGNVGSTTVIARNTMSVITGSKLDESLLERAFQALAQDTGIPSGAHQAEYRRELVNAFFFKFFNDVTKSLSQPECVTRCCNTYKGRQTFEEVPNSQDPENTLGHPVQHLAGSQLATGEAKFVDDISRRQGELYVARVLSDRPHAKILSVDASKAVAVHGVYAFYSAADLASVDNNFGLLDKEELFATDEVVFVGQTIGVVAADCKGVADSAAKLVKVTYEDMPTVFTIEDAIKEGSLFDVTLPVKCGDVTEGFAASDHVIQGEIYAGGQEHFYMEPQTSLAIPGEDGEMEVFTSTQNPTFIQSVVARNLGVPLSKVVIRTKRVGGAFGGKLTNGSAIAATVAVVAQKSGRAARLALSQTEDIKTTGKRGDYLVKYKVGFTDEGKLQALEAVYYGNGGSALDLSIAVLEKGVLHAEGAYKIPHVDVKGRLCKTNLPPRTAFRSLASFQAHLFVENIVSDVAKTCGMPENEVRQLNFYSEGDLTPYNQPLTNCTVQRVWKELIEKSDFEHRRSAVEEFNRANCYAKRGLVTMPMKYGIAIVLRALNQGGALVHVYTDGTVLVASGGVEFGQGFYTKIIQIAAHTLEIPVSKVFISETATNTVPNTSPSGASFTLELNGAAVKVACEQILMRLAPFKKDNPEGTWEEWVQAAYLDRVSLSATGFHKVPDVGFDWASYTGYPFSYFTYGAVCTEVEIDCLTGAHKVMRVDIVMDFGRSLNPAIDVGQIEGAFVQGLGYFTIEELRYSCDGRLVTCSRRDYKIPSLRDIPREINVHILKNMRNDKGILSSKAVGEPAICLSGSVFLAIKSAVSAARKEVGLSSMFRMNSPATCERIRMACGGQLAKQTT
ncbi:xanthine dehydrogenase/oxidase [Nematostella vectensis]|uniref:xanthine dehydrogenase/oxidase n=1 Tax=Nematostella vectensis TaxID=45351 RepID=UPI0020772C1A|nr:xanthine dehydrogenase/oxidase [Nematostella vectensis]